MIRRNLDAIFEPSHPIVGWPHSVLAYGGAPPKPMVKRLEEDDPVRVREVAAALERLRQKHSGNGDALQR